MVENMTIGQLARRARVNIETVRYYHRRGLLPKPSRPSSGYRRYSTEALARLSFIRRAQQLGFTLREIRELLSLGDGSCRQALALAVAKQTDIRSRIQDLTSMERTLQRLIGRCRRGHTTTCAIVETLSREE
jgi:MerR family transcriptional regulator, mercuric resistance operon regulatory protein